MDVKQHPQISREERLCKAYEAIEQMQLGEREESVKLAIKTLLVIRGAISPAIPDEKRIKIYSTIAKYVRASNAETLPALVDDVLHNISPEFVSHTALGLPVRDIYSDKAAPEARALLQEEAIPLIILMKRLYQQHVDHEEANSEIEEATSE